MLIDTVIHVLLIEDEEYDARRIRKTLELSRGQIEIVHTVSDGRAALDVLTAHPDAIDVVIMDMQIPGGLKGENLIHEIKKIVPAIQIIVVTKMTVNITDFEFANRLLRAGAFWYCTKYPTDIESYIYQPTDFIISIVNAYEKRRLELEQTRSARKLIKNVAEKLADQQMLGNSAAIQKIRGIIRQCAESDATVLVSGSSGTGKELVATNIHYESRRKLENFVPINCGSIPNDLIESELFGYEKGAFTGASAKKAGLFEAANHGTIFLDEIGELPFSAQVKLLRVIQEGEIEKIGRTEKLKVDVRIIAATNKNLEQEVENNRFRQDLYYRLNVVPIHVPRLNQRREDIPVIWDYFLKQMSAEMSRSIPPTEPDALDLLMKYEWPGNVRELKNVVQRLLFDGGEEITSDMVKTALHPLRRSVAVDSDQSIAFGVNDEVLPWRQMERLMREKYFRYVRKNSGSDADAAKKLGLAPPNYHRMCKEMGIKE
jgi:two-component system response regulator AtoC